VSLTPIRFFRYPADRVRIAIFLAIFCVDIAVYLLVDHWALLLLYFGLGILPKASVCAFNHHHQHVLTFEQPWLNRLLEIVYGLQTGATTNAWVLHHSLGHHVNYLDPHKDESRWMRADGSKMGEWEYSWIVTLTAYPRAYAVGARYPEKRRQLVVWGLITLAIAAALVAYRPLPGLIVFVLAPLFSLWGTAWATYAHHAGRSTASHEVASNNMVQRLYNLWTGNLGYHTAHHTRPGVHWSQLRALHDELAPHIPADAYVEPGWPWRWFGKSYLPTPEQVAALSAPPARPAAAE
jgi:fatty acid desaturase